MVRKLKVAASPRPGGKDEAFARTGDTPRRLVPTPEIQDELPLKDVDETNRTYQYRFASDVKTLQASLAAEGQHEPVDLLGKRPYTIVDGFRRVEAAKALGWKTIRAFIHRELEHGAAFCLAFTKNVVRRNLSAIERANAMVLALQRNIQRSELGSLFNLSEKQITRYLELATFPKDIQEALDGRAVTMAHARLLAAFKVENPGAWAKRIAMESLSSRELALLLREHAGTPKRGRHHQFIHIGDGIIRLRAAVVSRGSLLSDRNRFISTLEEALRIVRTW